MRRLYMIPMFVIMLFAQLTMMMAQGNKKETISKKSGKEHHGSCPCQYEHHWN